MKHILLLPLAAVALAGVLYAGLLVHRAYGIYLPWEVPRHLVICGRRYDDVAASYPVGPTSRVLTLRATLLRLPFPIPDMAPTRSSLPYAGCPALVRLVLKGETLFYAPEAGGP